MDDKENKIKRDVNDELVQQCEIFGTAERELCQCLNELIDKYNMGEKTTLGLLAYLSAGYVHQMQKGHTPGYKDAVEDAFNQIFEASLTSFDLHDVKKEVEKTKQKDLN